MTKKTPLYDQHLQANAKMVDFFGWQMPLHYGSQLQEHRAVRESAGIFDVSHMNIVDILGAGGRQFLRSLLSNDIDRLSHPGKGLYACMLNENGGIIDDLIVYHRASDNYRIVFNAATHDKDLKWLRDKSNGLAVFLQERSEYAMLAVQGPHALKKVLDVVNPAQMDAVSTLAPFEGVDVGDWFFARTGYTGEDGLEIILPAAEAPAFWQTLLNAGVHPCGLGARDSLRLEAGLMLYGQDMDESTSPLESGLGWTVAWEPQDRDFIGRGALALQKDAGAKRKLVGLVLNGKGVMRSGFQVIIEGVGQGVITSGGFSPELNKSIAFARVPSATEENVMVAIRDQLIPATVVNKRFYRRGQNNE